jgi:hypothetical protein
MKLVKAYCRNAGDGRPIEKERTLSDIKLHKHKFNNRPIPSDKRRILILTCFSEFGCESLALMYCIPKIIELYPGSYVICVGWYGRQYLYKHLVDEFWELDEEYQFLREFSDAFNSSSRNLETFESSLSQFGIVHKGSRMGEICLGNTCHDCKNFWGELGENLICPKCKSVNIDKALLNDIVRHRKHAVQIPRPSMKSIFIARKYLGRNPVGIFARGRLRYGRNLRPEFYVGLIKQLEQAGYTPIWLGEKQSVLPCPVDHIVDFSRMPESRDLELTLTIVSQLCFTIQFWTASTRLASMMGVPWILFESPDQIVGNGQEGLRIALTSDYNKKKLVLSQYFNVMENEDKALLLVDQAIQEMYSDNWEDIIGLVDQPELIKSMLSKQKSWR